MLQHVLMLGALLKWADQAWLTLINKSLHQCLFLNIGNEWHGLTGAVLPGLDFSLGLCLIHGLLASLQKMLQQGGVVQQLFTVG